MGMFFLLNNYSLESPIPINYNGAHTVVHDVHLLKYNKYM